MTDQASANQLPTPPWLLATTADLDTLDFEVPIAESTGADTNELSDRFRAAAQAADNASEVPVSAAGRVFVMLSAVTGMHFKPEDRYEPFGPFVTFPDGRRSAVPADFRVAHAEMLCDLASRTKHPVLRARLADVGWTLNRKRGDVGSLALAAYVEIVNKVDRRELSFRFENDEGALEHDAYEYLRRALQIGRTIGWEKAESVAARDAVTRLRRRAVEKGTPAAIHWFSELDLEFGVSDPAEVGKDLDAVLAAPPVQANPHLIVDLWRLAARAYHFAKKDDDKYRCQAAGAERWVSEADDHVAKRNSALLAAHALSGAIAQLHGIPGKKDRRTELRHRLIDIQARIPEEMSTFSQQLDLREIAERVEKAIAPVGLIDKLFMLSTLARSPDPDELTKSAIEMARRHPLSSIFATAHLDHEGKVVHRSGGGGFGDGANDSAVRKNIAQSESIRRQMIAQGQIEPARQMIMNQHFLSDDVLGFLLRHSPFVPHERLATFCRGFMRFFQGDYVSAIYILVPLLENSLRHVLKSHGHDVTIFDDATQTQEDRTISSLFEQMRREMEEIFTAAIVLDIENVFLSKLGPHLRHSLAHGLLHDGAPYGPDAIYAGALIFRLCLAPLYPYRAEFRLPVE